MTLEEAIQHCKERAKEYKTDCPDCAEDHRQLAEWLTELKERREKQGEWIKFTLEGGFLSSHKCSNCGFCGNQLWH